MAASRAQDWVTADKNFEDAAKFSEVAGDTKVLKQVLNLYLAHLSMNGGAADGLQVADRLLALCPEGKGIPDIELAGVLLLRGSRLSLLCRFEEAEKDLARCVEVFTRALGRDNAMVLSARVQVVNLYDTLGRYQEALDQGTVLQEDISRVGIADQLLRASAVGVQASALVGLGRKDEARQQLKLAEKLIDENGDKVPLTTVMALELAAAVHHRLGELSETEGLCKRALRILDEGEEDHSLLPVGTLNLLASVQVQSGRPKEARETMKRIGPLMKRLNSPDHPLMALSLETAARLRKGEGKAQAAKKLIGRALEVMEKTLGKDHSLTRELSERAKEYP